MFYPGSIWIKRMRYTLVASAVSINFFMQKLDNLIFDISVSIAQDVNALFPEDIESERYLLPLARAAEMIENSKMQWVADKMDLPSSTDIKNTSERVTRLAHTTSRILPLLNNVALLFKVIGLLAWIPIGLSWYWLIQDFRFGKVRWFTTICILSAFYLNFLSWSWLTKYWEICTTVLSS